MTDEQINKQKEAKENEKKDGPPREEKKEDF